MPGSWLPCPKCGAGLRFAPPYPEGTRLRCPRCAASFAPPDPDKLAERPPAGATALADVEIPDAAGESVDDDRPAEPRTRWRMTARVAAALLVGALAYVFGPRLLDFWHRHADGPFAPVGGAPAEPAVARPAPPVLASLPGFDAAVREASRTRRDMLIAVPAATWFPGDGFVPASTPTSAVGALVESPPFRDAIRGSFVVCRAPPGWAAPVAARYSAQTTVGEPAFVLATGMGSPYAVVTDPPSDPARAVALLNERRELRGRREAFFEELERVRGEEEVTLARQTLDFIEENRLTSYLPWATESWARSAAAADPDNARGLNEVFFEAEWMARFWRRPPVASAEAIARLDAWRSAHAARDPDRVAWLCLAAACLQQRPETREAARAHFEAAVALKPRDPLLRAHLATLASWFGQGIRGNGFAVAPGGYLLTVSPLLPSRGRTAVFLPGATKAIPTELVALDARRGLALLRVASPVAAELRPLPLRRKLAVAGETVVAEGYLSGAPRLGYGFRASMTTLLPLPRQGGAPPGLALRLPWGGAPYAGSPVCDASGMVVGQVSPQAGGMVVPAGELEAFVRSAIPSVDVVTADGPPLPWTQVERRVAPGVVIVTTMPPEPPAESTASKGRCRRGGRRAN